MTENEMYDAIIRNDADYDGIFFYGVRSTGIFCRPSCPSKKPLRSNVVFFRTAQEAMEAGFRPCKRCRSDLLAYHPMQEIAQEVRQHIEQLYATQSSWNSRLRELGLSQRRITEIFKDFYGMTPRAYMDRLRLREAQRLLSGTNEKIIDIASSVGFGSLSAFNRFFRAETRCSPGEWRKKNKGRWTEVPSSAGSEKTLNDKAGAQADLTGR
jgi:AraC family transcriptional regulator of adaptative response / methylphosphotriester-DNA alkyltransferase methyltransferase